MRRLTYLIATTLDGFIADADGGFDFFPMQGEHMTDLAHDFPETFPTPARAYLGIDAPNRTFDTVLMGRATYEVGAKVGLTSPYAHLRQVVFSRTLVAADPAVTLVAEDALGFVTRLKSEPGLGIWLCGGGALAAELAPVIDELVVKLNPLTIGRGIPMFTAAHAPITWQITAEKAYPSGYRRLTYARGPRTSSGA